MSIINLNCCPIPSQGAVAEALPVASPTPTPTKTPTPTVTNSVTPTKTPNISSSPTPTSTITSTPSTTPVLTNISQVPLEDSGGTGTISAHWEDSYRDSSYPGAGGYGYPGVSNELMVGTIGPGQPRILSQLSIKTLVDFGYIENNPNASEGNPTIIRSISAQNISDNQVRLNCQINIPTTKIKTIILPNVTENNLQTLSAPVLFNKLSWASIVSEPYKTYLDQAADRWSTYINYNPTIFTAVQAIPGWSAWNGLALDPAYYSLYTNAASYTIASCGPISYVDLQSNSPGVQFNSLTFQLNINNHYAPPAFSANDWINILTHELGHALGIGIYWDPYFAPAGGVPPVGNFLDGNSYTNCKNAYLNIIE